MNIVSTLIKNNQHKVDNKEIYWKITKFSLELKVNSLKIDLVLE